MTIHRLKPPLVESEIRRLAVGDVVYIDGTLFTARDQAHRRALEYSRAGKSLPVDLSGQVVYHCGPIAVKENEGWRILAAGPTTSMRMELFEAEFIKRFGPRVLIGKAGMGSKTAEACKKFGAVVGDYTGGTAVLAGRQIIRVEGVEWYDLGMPEAIWILEVKDFGPVTISIDTAGRNLHEEVKKEARRRKDQLFQRFNIGIK